MFQKIGATAALIALATSSLTGCTPEKLSTEETYTYLSDKAKQVGLAQKIKEGQYQVMLQGSYDGMKALNAEFIGLLDETAEQTDDPKFSEALYAQSEYYGQSLPISNDENLSEQKKNQRQQKIDSTPHDKVVRYLDEACANAEPLFWHNGSPSSLRP